MQRWVPPYPLLAVVLSAVLLIFTATFSEGAADNSPTPATAKPTPAQAADFEDSVRFLRVGLTGTISTEVHSTDLTGDGISEVLLGTSSGLYILSQGNLIRYIPTSSAVKDIVLMDDVTEDDRREVAVAVDDTYFPNVRVYDTATGEKVWQFVPTQEVFIPNLMWTQQQTPTYDVIAVDLTADGTADVAITSGYSVYALEGKTGKLLWRFDSDDNLWDLAITPDMTGDGTSDLAVGGQVGTIHTLNGRDGSLLWEKKHTTDYEARDERGGDWKSIERSVWDIIPVHAWGVMKAVVSSEDGAVRLLDLRDGTVEWEAQPLDFVSALLDRYYQRKNGRPTSPGDFHFFNLRAFLTDDVTGDGVGDILVSAFLGRGASQGNEPRGAGLFMLDITSGATVWENTAVDLEQVGQIVLTELEGDPVVLLPGPQIVSVSLVDGVIQDPIEVAGVSRSREQDQFAIEEIGDGELLIVSERRDALGITLEGDVVWDFPRVAGAAVEQGDFTGDETQDFLVRSIVYSQQDGPIEIKARVLFVVDGQSKQIAWSYSMPYEEFASTGGIGGVAVAPDLNEDGKQDIVGYLQSPIKHDGREDFGENTKVLALSGADGSIILSQPVTDQAYYGDWGVLESDPDALEQMIRNRFEAEMETHLPEEMARQEEQQRDEFERNLEGQLGQFEERRRNEYQGQIENEWGEQERQRWQEFEEQLQGDIQQWQKDGTPEHQVEDMANARRDDFSRGLNDERQGWKADRWNDFEAQLTDERGRQEEELRHGFEQQIAGFEEQMRRDWLENFERDQLPRELEEWGKRLSEELQGRRIDKRIQTLQVLQYPDAPGGAVIFVGGFRDVWLLSIEGDLLWTRTVEPWLYQDPMTGEQDDSMRFRLEAGYGTDYRVLGDLNGDSVDDLVAFTGQNIAIGLSDLRRGGFDIRPGAVIEIDRGFDPRQAEIVEDLDGDGVKDFIYPLHQENRPPRGIFTSSGTGQTLFELEDYDPGQKGNVSVTLDLDVEDLDNDGHNDAIYYQRWVQDAEGSRLRVIDTRSGEPLWDFNEYKETYLFDNYQGPIMPACSISDISGDGVADLALVRNLTWQAGAYVEVYDVVSGKLVKRVVLEDVEGDDKDEPRWHPGLLVREAADFTGDGLNELVVITMLGETPETKRPALMVVDMEQEEVVADFQVLGTDLFNLRGGGEFGVVGMTGDVYLLSVANELKIDVSGDEGGSGSPITVRWTGVRPGSFSQVFVDGVEIARTNDSEVTVSASKGQHQVTVRSLDELGRGVYQSVEFTVEKGTSVMILAFLVTGVLLVLVLWGHILRVARKVLGRQVR